MRQAKPDLRSKFHDQEGLQVWTESTVFCFFKGEDLMERIACLIMAAGSGKRMKTAVKKQFIDIDGIPVLGRTIKKFDTCGLADTIVVVSPKDDMDICKNIAEKYCTNTEFMIVEGGKERYNSVFNGLKAVEGKCDYVMIQDGVRPFVSYDTIQRAFDAAKEYGASVPAVPVKDTIKAVDETGFTKQTLNRSELWAVQTPQTFKYDLIKKAYDNLPKGADVTDDASVAELNMNKVKIVMGNYENIKITTSDDLVSAKAFADKEEYRESTKKTEKSQSLEKLPKETETVNRNVVIYTDGACSGNPGKGGYGAVLLYKGKRKELSAGYELTTNNRMELLAVIESLSLLKTKCEVTLYSDSKYVVDAVNKGWMAKWEKNNWMRTKTEKASNSDLWIRLSEQIKKHDVKFVWVKGHADNIENERCDELARNAITCQKLLKDSLYGC